MTTRALRFAVGGLVVLTATAARADDRRFEVGGGARLDVLGPYDVGKGLGGPAEHDDLGPASLGVFLYGGAMVRRELSIGVEATLAVGGRSAPTSATSEPPATSARRSPPRPRWSQAGAGWRADR